MSSRCFSLLSACLLAAVSSLASAQGASTYPNKPVTLAVGYQAGGSVDLVARAIGPSLSKRLGQPVVIENVAGAGGTIAATKVSSAAPDGYTLLVGSPSEVGISHLTNKKLPYDPIRDFEPIGLVGSQPMVLVASPKSGQPSLASFLKFAAQNPGKAMYASSGIGTPLHLVGETIRQKAKVALVHIPYRGAPAMATDVLGGQLDYAVFVLSSALPYIKDGRMIPLAVTSAQRNTALPQVPALAESPVLSGLDMNIWFGFLAPAKTPAPILERLRTELKAVVNEPEVKRKLHEAGLVVTPDVPFAKFLKSEVEKYKTVVDFANIAE